MRQAKSRGALVVSLLLLAAVIGMTIGMAATIGVTVWKAAKGEVSMETVQPEPEPVQDEVQPEPVEEEEKPVVLASSAEMVKYTEGDKMYAVITGCFDDGSLWSYCTQSYDMTELEPITEIYAYEDLYLFCAGGEVIALDMATGNEVWVNADFGGYSPVILLDDQRNIYLSGYYGPDLHVLDINGSTIARVEQFDENYCWPYEIRRTGDETVEVVFGMGPEGDGKYVLAYDMAAGTVTTPEPPAQMENLAWMDSYRAFIAGETAEAYDNFALIYLDEDTVPELFARGMDKGALYSYDEATNTILEYEIDPYDFCYYPCAGVYSQNKFEENTSEEIFYTYNKGEVQYVGTAKMHHYDEKEPDCWWNGEAVAVNEFYKKLDAFRPANSVECYPSAFPRQMFLMQLDCWQNPSENIYWSWKQEYMDCVRSNMEHAASFALVDVDGNGVPELFQRYETEYGANVGIWVYNERTQQYMYQYLSGEQILYLPGTGLVGATYVHQDYRSDTVYQVNDGCIRRIAQGDRTVYADGGQTCFYNGAKISQQIYEQYFSPVFDEDAVSIADSFISAEEMLVKLK